MSAAGIVRGTTGRAMIPLPVDGGFRERLYDIQTAFVDDPARSVQEADALLNEVIRAIASALAENQSAIREKWHDRDDVDTEDLRVQLKEYRALLHSLLPRREHE